MSTVNYKGIDVSRANGDLDWSAIKKSGIDFAILRCGFGSESESQIDKTYYKNANGCVKNNIPFGVYHFAYCLTEKDASDEADFAIKLANTYKKYIKFIAYDLEEDTLRYCTQNGVNHTKESLTKCATTFLNKVKKAGYIPVIYVNYNFLKNELTNEIRNYPIWIAYPDHSSPEMDCCAWQYSWKGKISGCNCDFDLDIIYDSSLISKQPLASATATSTAKVKVAVDTSIKIDVIYQVYSNGKWYNWIKNINTYNSDGYAGVNNIPISCIRAKTSKGHIKYRVRLKNGEWLGWITDFNTKNSNGYAGIYNKDIDLIQMQLIGVSGYSIQYRVSNCSTNFLPWVTDFNNTNDSGYAGIKGKSIDKLQVRIIKKG